MKVSFDSSYYNVVFFQIPNNPSVLLLMEIIKLKTQL